MLITSDERRRLVINEWEKTKQSIEDLLDAIIKADPNNPSAMMVSSGARGSLEQYNQLIGMVGTKVSPTGRKIELPIKSNYKEGLTTLEYFLATHGARKGLSDTALRTSDAGYLTRRLVDVCQDVIVNVEDCETDLFIVLEHNEKDLLAEPIHNRVEGRVPAT